MRLSTTLYLAHQPGRLISSSGALSPSDKDTIVQVDTTSGIIILDLPAGPQTNDTYYLADRAGTWQARNVILASNIFYGVQDYYTLDIGLGLVAVTWRGNSIGWTVGLDAPMLDNAVVNQLLANKAPVLSPDFSGVPTSITGTPGAGGRQIATQAYVEAALTAEKDRAIATEATKANALNASLSGIPTAPTAVSVANNTQIANTMWVKARLAEQGTRSLGAWAGNTPLTTDSTLTTAAEGTVIGVNTVNGSFTIFMPATPTVDAVYSFADVGSKLSSNPVVITGLNKVHGQAENNITMDMDEVVLVLKYTGTAFGYIILNG
jgi:hypothetical protein